MLIVWGAMGPLGYAYTCDVHDQWRS